MAWKLWSSFSIPMTCFRGISSSMYKCRIFALCLAQSSSVAYWVGRGLSCACWLDCMKSLLASTAAVWLTRPASSLLEAILKSSTLSKLSRRWAYTRFGKPPELFRGGELFSLEQSPSAGMESWRVGRGICVYSLFDVPIAW